MLEEESQGTEGHLLLDTISLQGEPSSSEARLKYTQGAVLCNLPPGFLILFEGGLNNAMCSLLASSVESFKYMFLPPRSFFISASCKRAGPAKGRHRIHC